MSPVQNISVGRGGKEHDAADATMAANVGHRFAGELDRRRPVQYRVVSGDEPPDGVARRID